MSGNREVRTCGCGEGKVGVLIALGLFALFLAIGRSTIPVGRWPIPVVAIGFLFVGALLGKLVGMLAARILLRRARDPAVN